jgi:hypothetical protein
MSINNLNTYLNIKDSHLRVVSGNVYAQAMNIGGINVETAHGLQSVSDTGNVTSNTLQFSNAITGFVTTANAQIGRDLIVSGNTTVSTDLTVSANATVADTLTISEHLIASKEATVTGNLHVTTIRSDSNVVTEYTGPHDRPLRKYPEVALTANSDKGYVAIGSSNGSGSYPEYTAFDGVVTNSTTGWASDGTYASGTGISTFSWNGSFGEYLSLELPKALRLQKMFLKGYEHSGIDYQNAPRDIKLYGSNNETNWVLLKTETDLPIDSITNNSTYININATEHYKYIRLQITKTYRRTAAYTRIGELEYYGHEEGSGSLDTTLKTVYNVPATTGTQLEVYYDAKGESTVQSPIPDLSPNTNTGAVSGHSPTLDSTDGIDSFKFNGSSQYVTGAHGLTTGSDPVHTISLWFKRTVKVGQFEYLVQLGQGGTNFQQSAIFIQDDEIAYGHWGSGVGSYPIVDNIWYHVATTFTGGNASTLSNHKIYVNGVEIGINSRGSDGLFVLTGTQLTLGRNNNQGGTPGNYFNGSIANFRLFSKALNADQIKELYDYQKDYFLGSKSQVTLYKGHLGVGVTEPSGQLELAGDERIQAYPPGPMGDYETLIPGHGVFCASASSIYTNSTTTYLPHFAFNKTQSDTPNWNQNTWNGGDNVYSDSTGLYTGSEEIGGIKGDWIKLKFPYQIKLQGYEIKNRGAWYKHVPDNWAILGSNDDNNWEAVDSVTSTASGTSLRTSRIAESSGETVQSRRLVVNSTKYYKYLALVTTKLRLGPSPANVDNVNFAELIFFGTPGPTTLDKGSLTLGRSLDVPRVSRYDVDTETPRPEKLVLDFDTTVNSSPTDISGQGNHGVFYGTAQYSAAEKAFTGFPSSSSNYIKATLNGASGAYAHTQSYWVNGVDGTSRAAFTVGTNIAGAGVYAYLYWDTTNGPGGRWTLNTDSAASATWVQPIEDNRWYHVVLTYDGGSSNSSWKFYLDGEYQTPTTMSVSYALALPSNPEVRIGRDDNVQWYNGMVSNPKVYSVALEPSEVRKLYRLGRTGRSMVISDTAVGIGKVPEAQLDVRGNLRVDGDILASVPYYAARQRAINSQATNRGIVYDAYVYTNYPGSFVRNSNTDGYYQPPRNGMYQVYMECIASGSGNVNIQRRTGTTVNINHCDRHWNYSQGGWDSVSASALIPITDCTTQNIRIYVNTGIVWSYDTYHGSAYFKWFSEIPERRQHHVT